MKKLILILLVITIASCKNKDSKDRIPVEPDNGIGNGATVPPVLSFSENIEEAHNKAAFQMQQAVSFDIDLKFGGSQRLNAKVSMTTNSTRVKVEKADGSTIIYDGNEMAISPKDANSENARFDIFTWQYFFALPFKLTDPGTVWKDTGEKLLDSTNYQTSRLSFENNVGETPDDWYMVYQDPKTRLLKAAAYIVTFNTEKQAAEQNPHAIVYSDFEAVKQVTFATKWSFHNWSESEGFGDKIGEAQISNIQFFNPEKNYFNIPENSKNLRN